MNAGSFDLVHELRPQSGRPQPADNLAVLDAGLLEDEDVGHGDDITFHALTSVMLTTLREPSRMRSWWTIRSIAEEICSRMARTGSSMPAISIIVSRRESVSRGLLEWSGGHRAVMAGVHGLQHVQRLHRRGISPTMMRSGRMRSAVDHQVANGDFAASFNIGRARFQRDHVLLAQLQFGRIFDRDDALICWDEAGEDVEQRRLARAGAA